MNRTYLHSFWAILAFACWMVLSSGAMVEGAPVVIDDFSTPDPSSFFLVGVDHTNDTPVEQSGLSEAVGGERDILVSVLGTAAPQSAHLLTGFDASVFIEGVVQVATAGSPGTVVTLQYDGTDSDGATLVNSRMLMLDLLGGGGNDRLEIDFLSVDAPAAPGLDLTITATSPGGSAVFVDIVPESGSPITRVAPFAAFTADAGFSFSEVDSIEFVLNGSGVTDVDFAISQIQAIPEPASALLALIGLGGVMVFSRRRVSSAI